MKKLFKYFVLILGVCFMLPGVVNAASITLDGSKKDNTAQYNLVYTADETPSDEAVRLEITKTHDDLNYQLNINNELSILGIESCSGLVCSSLILKNVPTGTVIGTIAITNSYETEKETEISVKLDGVETDKKTFTLTKLVKTTQSTTTTTTTQRIKSSDATLSSLKIDIGTFDQTFSKDVMEYSITGIKDTINSVKITPTCTDKCEGWTITCPTGGCSVSNTRKVTLQNGANKVAINVISEDGTANKTYILNIYRGEVVTSSAYLEELKIKDGKLSPNFDPMVNDYSIEVGMDIEKLDIITTTEDPNAEVTIKGNEKLVEGENTITITVTSSDGESKQVYTILVNKLAEEEEVEKHEKVPTTKVEKKENNTLLIILLSLLGLGLIIVVFLIIFKKKKNKKNNDKNDKNNKPNGNLEETKSTIEDENTETLNILKETKDMFKEEPKDDIDEALDDLMKTKRLELGDLDF